MLLSSIAQPHAEELSRKSGAHIHILYFIEHRI